MTDTNSHSPVLMIALDSAEPVLIERWIRDGTLPNLKRLCTLGGYGRLASSAEWLDGSIWPTFYTGSTPADHGVYSHTQWRAEQMKHAPVSPERYPVRPFWRCLSGTARARRRVVAIDLPMAFPPEPFDGLEIYSLMNRDLLGAERAPASHPKSFLEEMRQEFGVEGNLVGDEVWGIQHVEDLLLLRDQLIQGTRTVTKVAQALMNREKWDLFMVSFMATHRGGHKLWNLSSSWEMVGGGNIYNALQDVYVECDAAVGQLASAAGEGVTLLVFSLHGMRPNASRSCLLPEMLNRILARETKYVKESRQRVFLRPLQMLKERIPSDVRHARARSRHLMPPLSLLFKMYRRLRAANEGRIDWATTPAFTLVSDLQGYVRVNLRGREAFGIVEPGEEYDQLCSKIAEGLGTFVDADTGKPVVEGVKRAAQLFGQGRRLKDLPDLVIRWVPSPAANHRAVISSRYGSIPWKLPGRHPTGRSGNHGPEGFMLAVGTGVKHGSKIVGASILDLAPTVCALLKVPIPVGMCGNVIDFTRS